MLGIRSKPRGLSVLRLLVRRDFRQDLGKPLFWMLREASVILIGLETSVAVREPVIVVAIQETVMPGLLD